MAEIIQPRIFGVAELNNYLREYLAEDDFLREIAIKGEISGYKAHSSGHIYFSLRDKSCSIKTVMFRSYAAGLTFRPVEGMEVVVIGSVSLFERDGVCQLYARELFPSGEGQLAQAMAKLKQALAAEGLFNEAVKKPIPAFAETIGVITSKEGAAWADIQRVAYARWPQITLRLYPAAVQGEKAADEIAQAIAKADQGGHDVLICGRGGGASEDLAAFDTEAVVRAIAAATTPLISAVGHEIDFSLADLAADLRAATPSHAAELAVLSVVEQLDYLSDTARRLRTGINYYLADKQQRLQRLSELPYFTDVNAITQPHHQLVAAAEQRLQQVCGDYLRQREQGLVGFAQRLRLLSPLGTLSRGYAIVQAENGLAVKDADAVAVGDTVRIKLANGGLICDIKQKLAEDK